MVFLLGLALFVLAKHHSVVVRRAALANGGTAGAVTRAVSLARALCFSNTDGVGGTFQVHRPVVLVRA